MTQQEQVELMVDYIMKHCLWQFHSRAWDREKQNAGILGKTKQLLCDEPVERETAARAVAVAVDRATAYATALGKRTVTPLEVADARLLSGDGTPPVAAPRMFARAASADVAPSAVEFRPDDVVVTAAVEARFTTT